MPNSGAASPVVEHYDSYENSEDDEEIDAAESVGQASTEGSDAGSSQRPGVSKTTSDSALPGGKMYRKRMDSNGQSPPRNAVLNKGGRQRTSSDSSRMHYDAAHFDLPEEGRPDLKRGSSHDSTMHAHHHYSLSSGAYPAMPKKRHITFNHKVEQCISLDVDDIQSQRDSGKYGQPEQPYSNKLHRYGSNTSRSSSSSEGSSSDEEEDDVLTFKSSSPKSPSFMKPLLASPTDPNGPSAGLPQGQKIPYGTHGPHGQINSQPHTIAKIAPTTLKEFELLPGPTPIVVFEDGKITALYGTEEDYVFDAEEHRGMGAWIPPTKQLPENAISDDTTEDEEEASAEGGPLPRVAAVSGDFYHAQPAQTTKTPVTTSARYANPEEPASSLVSAPGVASGKTDYFGGQEPGFGDMYDSKAPTSSQANFGAGAGSANPYDFSRGVGAGGMQATNANTLAVPVPSSTSTSASSSSSTLSGQVAGGFADPSNTNINIALSSSPSGRTPGKSILKRGRESQSTGGEYYPVIPPASTRASRAHAAMFDENGDEIVPSPKRSTQRLPDVASSDQQQAAQSK